MEYLTRLADQPPATDDELRSLTRQVEAIQVVLSLLSRDLVKACRAALADPAQKCAVQAHREASDLLLTKLGWANLAYFEARDSLLYAPRRPEAYDNNHPHSH